MCLSVLASSNATRIRTPLDWIGLSSVLRPRQHSIGYMGDGFYERQLTQTDHVSAGEIDLVDMFLSVS